MLHLRLVWIAAVGLLVGIAVTGLVRPMTSSAASVQVRITSTLSPAAVTIAPGDSVTWVNADGQRHRMRSTSGPRGFDSGNLEAGESFSLTLTVEGAYTYRDDRTGSAAYNGTITVRAGAAAGGGGGGTGGGAGGGGGGTPPPGTATVALAGRAFTPANVTVALNGTVTWNNNDGRAHTVTADGGAFNSGTLAGGQTFAFSFPAAGSFSYFCELHTEMRGSVQVATAAGAVPSAAPAPPPSAAPPPAPSSPTAANVQVVDYAFSPAAVTIAAGGTVTWTNVGAARHTATAAAGEFDSGFMAPGASFTRVFGTAGTFGYICDIHPEMQGSVTVTGAATTGGGAQPAAGAASDSVAAAAAARGAALPLPPPPPGSASVDIVDLAFTPASVTVGVGGTVSWINKGTAVHTVTGTGAAFESGLLRTGGTFQRTFTAAGTYAYLCAVHPQMTGTVVVREGAVGAEPGQPAPGVRVSDGSTAADGQPAGAAKAEDQPAGAKSEVAAARDIRRGSSGTVWTVALLATLGIIAAITVGATAILARARPELPGS